MRAVEGRAGRCDQPFGWLSDVPRHGRFDPYDAVIPSGDEVPGERRSDDEQVGGAPCGGTLRGCALPGLPGEPEEPQWALDASSQGLRERLAAAVHAPAGIDAAEVIEMLSAALPGGIPGAWTRPIGPDVPTVDAAGLVQGIRVVARLVNHFQAVQQQWIAALARPGVGVPLDQVVEMCRHPGRTVPGALRPPDHLPADLPTDGDGEPDLRALLDHPAWRGPLADTSARLVSAEVGCALRLAPTTARARVEKALTVIDELPATYAAQYAGDLDGYRASIISDRTDVLSGPQRARVEQRVLPGAGTRTPAALRDQVDRAVVATDPDAAARRTERARSGRGVRLEKARDDMAEFRALLGCTDGQLAFGVLDEQASALMAAGLAAGRGASQLRADVFCDLFRTLADTGHAHLTSARVAAESGSGAGDREAAGTASAAAGSSTTDSDAHDPAGGRFTGVCPCHGRCADTRGDYGHDRPAGAVAGRRRSIALNVYADFSTLAGLDDRAGELAGYGTITAATARALAASADTVRALIVRRLSAAAVAGLPDDRAPSDAANSPGAGRAHRSGHASDPARSRACGTLLDAGRAVYRPPEALLDYVTARDRTCRWPGCRAPARRCDVDHRHAFADGGATCACNLDVLCRWHHRVKTFTAWRAEPRRYGTLVWISPTGHRYPAESGHPLLDRGGGVDPPGMATADTAPEGEQVGDPGRDAGADPPPF